MTTGRFRTATVLKILHGSDRAATRRDESVVAVSGKPEFPPLADADPEERKMFDWCVEVYFIPTVHGARDGTAFLEMAKTLVRMQRLEKKIKEFGEVVKNPQSGRAMRNPFALARDSAAIELRKLMGDLGATPSARLRFAPPIGRVKDASAWDDFD